MQTTSFWSDRQSKIIQSDWTFFQNSPVATLKAPIDLTDQTSEKEIVGDYHARSAKWPVGETMVL